MGIPPETVATLADMREWAADPGALIYTMPGKRGSIAIFRDEVTSRNDEQLLEFIRRRLNET